MLFICYDSHSLPFWRDCHSSQAKKFCVPFCSGPGPWLRVEVGLIRPNRKGLHPRDLQLARHLLLPFSDRWGMRPIELMMPPRPAHGQESMTSQLSPLTSLESKKRGLVSKERSQVICGHRHHLVHTGGLFISAPTSCQSKFCCSERSSRTGSTRATRPLERECSSWASLLQSTLIGQLPLKLHRRRKPDRGFQRSRWSPTRRTSIWCVRARSFAKTGRSSRRRHWLFSAMTLLTKWLQR